ncbi:MAG: hypothetical protein ACJ8AT_35460 [Hyalangium sp.]|uniref:hypothetical protein n=1 Tax=Hyalangium sp. TaxID=2028555 RepID=UPI00389AC3C3
MKMLKTNWVCALAMLAAACGDGKSHEPQSTPSAAVEEKAPEVPAQPSNSRLELRLTGTNAGTTSTVLLGVRDIRVAYAGRELRVDMAKEPMDLSDGQRTWLAGTFDVPAEADTIQVALYLDDYGGFVDAAGSGEIDARGLPIRFEAPVKRLRASGRAVVSLDLGRSLMDAGEERKVLLPQYGVSY